MWPKVFAQLVELLPHVSRLIPMADLFFTTKTASEKANEAAMKSLSEGVRADMGQVTASASGLYRQLQDQSAQVTELAAESQRTRVAVESQAERVRQLQAQVAGVALWVKGAVGLLLAVLAVCIAILLRMR